MSSGSALDMEGDELCLIDARVTSLADLTLRPHLSSLNLHCNLITKMENLLHLRNLCHMDLSSNQISKMECLDGLISLKTLNLACNRLEEVKGIGNLRSLKRINLSFNNIHNLGGFYAIQGEDFQLEKIELHGNKVTNQDHVLSCLMGCSSLRKLTLSLGGADNPVCHLTGYREKMFAGLPQIQVLDSLSRGGQPTESDDLMDDIPGLEQYLEYLVSSNGSVQERNPISLATPRIDAALDLFKRHATKTDASTSATDHDNSAVTSPRSAKKTTDHADRLAKLENQLAQLLYNEKQKSTSSSEGVNINKTPVKVTRHAPKRDTDFTDESDTEPSCHGIKKRGRTRTYKSRIPNYQRSTSSSKARSQSRERDKKSEPCPGPSDRVGSSASLPNEPNIKSCNHAGRQTNGDQQRRDEMRETYVTLMRELESERERRWKAEQASKKLVDHITELQSKAKDSEGFQDTAIEATTRLKQALTNEREVRTRMQLDIDKLKDEVVKYESRCAELQQADQEQRGMFSELQNNATTAEREYIKQLAHESKKSQEAQLRAAAAGRELDLVRTTVKNLKGQVQQLQGLLADREQDHRKDLENRYRLGSKELQDYLSEEVAKVENRHQGEIKTQQLKVDELSKQYSELEDEFRMALEIESSRFKELQDAFERVSEDNAHLKRDLSLATKKEEKGSSMVTELTSLVKEQKGRITELARSKQEQITEFKDRIATLETHVDEARKRMVSMELLKQEKAKLAAQVTAQDSVIDGLKAERKLWGEELAHQGVSLAQDRGRMEAKIETLQTEVVSLKRQLEREADSVKIKAKMIEDQTETIRKLKEALLERDESVKTARDEALQSQRDLEDQLANEQAASTEYQEKLERVKERKDELKAEVADLKEKLENVTALYNKLNTHWKQKSGLIGDLEERVSQMKTTWENKEKKLQEERDKAVDAARLAVEKLRTMDEAFRQQLEAKDYAHQEALSRLQQDKQEEIDAANEKVMEVEEEMRILLRENEANKRAIDQKMKALSKQFDDLRGNVL